MWFPRPPVHDRRTYQAPTAPPLNPSAYSTKPSAPARFLPVLAGAGAFLTIQYGLALWRLTQLSGSMENKFSALARDQHLGFLIRQNLHMLVAYVLLAAAATFLALPPVTWWSRRSRRRSFPVVALVGFAIVALLHGYCTLRLMVTRPYFVNEAEFGNWYYKALDLIPHAVKPAAWFVLFTILPITYIIFAVVWHIRRRSRKQQWLIAATAVCIAAGLAINHFSHRPTGTIQATAATPNIIIIGSDSLRADHLGCAGYRPQRSDGPAAAGVSPTIDALAADSIRFENCYTAIASTLESGVQLMTSQYPQSHGIRFMYPDRATVENSNKRTVPLAKLLHERGYDTEAIGDWCAGYYEVTRLGFDRISVSNFDNFKIYMSEAVVMAHAVVPLYFDNPLGYRIFPQLQSFANFVTPKVVTERVEQRLAEASKSGRPFFWHVFYSCNHLPYRCPEPYVSMFADPSYQGKNRNGVDFDINEFIGGTDLESKWKALQSKEIAQIRALYDGCTREFDDCVAGILAAIKRDGLADNTVVIITADHGDDLYEPGVTLGHGLTFNGGCQANHVPMIVHVPGLTPKTIPETVRLIDIAPTLADLTGTPPSPTWQGLSFAPWIRAAATPEYRPYFGETGYPFVQFTVPGIERPHLPPMDQCTFIDETYNYQFVVKPEFRDRIINAKQRCLKTRDWKLVCTPTAAGTRHYGLFHMTTDPQAETDVAASRPEVLAPLRRAIDRWMDEHIESPIREIFPAGEP